MTLPISVKLYICKHFKMALTSIFFITSICRLNVFIKVNVVNETFICFSDVSLYIKINDKHNYVSMTHLLKTCYQQDLRPY